MARRQPTCRPRGGLDRARWSKRPPWGQHFLADGRIHSQIIAQLRCQPDDCWLEIGAGHGEMTLALAERSGCVAAVERDAKLVGTLRARLSAFPRSRVVEADILETSLPALADEMGCARWRVYGNLPYYITSPILQHLFRAAEIIGDIHVVVQREVAERLAASPGGRDFGYLSVLTQFHATAEILQRIPRGAFRPPPQVESALVHLTPPGKQPLLGVAEPESFLRFVQVCFHQKRKTLRNNLRGLYEPGRVQEALAELGLDARARAEELELEEFARLYRILSGAGHSVVGS